MRGASATGEALPGSKNVEAAEILPRSEVLDCRSWDRLAPIGRTLERKFALPEPFRSASPESHPLPPYFGLMAVDAKDSTRLPSLQQARLSRDLTAIVHYGLELAGLKGMSRQFESHSGDGLAFGFDPSHLPFVISPFADVLNTLLQDHNAGPGPPSPAADECPRRAGAPYPGTAR